MEFLEVPMLAIAGSEIYGIAVNMMRRLTDQGGRRVMNNNNNNDFFPFHTSSIPRRTLFHSGIGRRVGSLPGIENDAEFMTWAISEGVEINGVAPAGFMRPRLSS
jgi:hypothetical protein